MIPWCTCYLMRVLYQALQRKMHIYLKMQGLLDLYMFKRERPHVDLSPHLAKTSLQFRSYIQRGLAQV